TITITINGADESLLTVVDDTNAITEDAVPNTVSGNVMTNDSDPDGDAITVVEVDGAAGNVTNTVTGTYGSVVINTDGSYTYTLNNALPATQGLDDGETVVESFSYSVADAFGNQGSASLNITITGAEDVSDITIEGTDSAAEAV
ncbi:MAG: VCBS domain-containing protein, partial [Cellvibrionaceae bacterium]